MATDEIKAPRWKIPRPVADAVAGALAGGTQRFVISPLDVIKIRFQVQIEPTNKWHRAGVSATSAALSKYTGVVQAFREIVKDEGVAGLWRGIVPAQLLVMPYCAIQFVVWQKFNETMGTVSATSTGGSHVQLSPALSYLGGSVAGAAATIGSYPFDLLRTIMASQGEPKVYQSMMHAASSIFKEKGIGGLYAGITPTLVEILPYAGLQFGLYDALKRRAATRNKKAGRLAKDGKLDAPLTPGQRFVCGLIAGTVAKVTTHPLDVVKKRFQVEGLMRNPMYGARIQHKAYKNMWDCMQRIVANEGWMGLYKGMLPSVIKAAPAAAITFAVYEILIRELEPYTHERRS